MTIVNQQLHPENDPDTIIHPETSPSQAGVALYEHRIVAQVLGEEDKFTVFFNIINTNSTEFTLETLVKYTIEKYSYSFGCFGSVFIKSENKNYPAIDIYFFKDVNDNDAISIDYIKENSNNSSEHISFENVRFYINDKITKII